MRHSLIRSNAVLLPRSNITALKSNICCATDLVSMSEMVRYGADAIGIVSDKGPISRISRAALDGQDAIQGRRAVVEPATAQGELSNMDVRNSGRDP